MTDDWVRDEEANEPEVGGRTLFQRYSMAELVAEPDDFAWLIRGLLADPTYGQNAGEMKTLKSYVQGFIEIGLAAGVPIFGRFEPLAQRPVVAYVGEGGRKLWSRRRKRICSAMGVKLEDLDDLHAVFVPVRRTAVRPRTFGRRNGWHWLPLEGPGD